MTRLKFTVAALAMACSLPFAAARANDQQELVERAKITVDSLRNEENLGPAINKWLPRARAVMVFPNLFKAGFIIGGEGGTGVLMVKGTDGSWSPPAFYSMASGSLGLQIGAQSSEVILIIMNDGALSKLMSNSFKLGADASIAVGPIGAGLEASTTTNLKADILAYAKSAGLFGGGALEGSVINVREEWNRAYYGEGATARAIVFDRRFENYGSGPLRQTLSAPQ